jgi:deoxyhypusine synthase
VSTSFEQMVYGEATVFFPLIAGYAWHKKSAKGRKGRRFAQLLNGTPAPAQ